MLGGALRIRRPGERNWREIPLAALGNDRFGGTFVVDRPGRWQFAVAAWSDRIATWQDEVRRKLAAGQTDLAGELAEGAALLGVDRVTVDEALAIASTDRHGEVVSQRLEVDVDRVLARFGAWYELFPRSFGGFRGVGGAVAAPGRAGIRRRLPAARSSDRLDESEGPEQRARRGAGRPGVTLGDRVGRRRARRDRSGARDLGRFRRARRGRASGGNRDRARLRDPVLPRPPVAEGAPRMVQPSAGRDAEVRGESAEALPGHLQRQLRVRGLARAVAGAARRRRSAGSSAGSRCFASTTRTRSRPRSGSG